VDISNLARSEFSCPEIIMAMIEAIISPKSDDKCYIAPITVAPSLPVCSSHNARAVIVDGNNRITTITLLKFVSPYGLSDLKKAPDQLRDYCRDTSLGPACFVDFCIMPQTLQKSAFGILDQLRSCTTLNRFEHVVQVPCLVTEEPSFFTKVLVDIDETIAQPIHQHIFATDDFLVALPAKMQSHGRAKEFKALPIRWTK
jgi:hypothetical protein